MARATKAAQAASPSTGGKVRVPQADGEITFTPGGDVDAARTYQVTDHLVSPRNNDERQQLLALVDGARLATKGDLPNPPALNGAGNDGAGSPGDDNPKGS